MRRSVVLPIPFGPTRASLAPLATEKETSRKISSAPNDLERDAAVINDMGLLRPVAAEKLVHVCLRLRRQWIAVVGHGDQVAARLLPVEFLGIDAGRQVLDRLQVAQIGLSLQEGHPFDLVVRVHAALGDLSLDYGDLMPVSMLGRQEARSK